jgi:hypothetical protein
LQILQPFTKSSFDPKMLSIMSTTNHSLFLLANDSVGWPSAVVAIVIIAFLAVVMAIALKRYTMDEVLKLWAALGTIAGIAVGTFGTYFFTSAKVQVAQAQTQAAQTETRLVQSNLNMLKGASQIVKGKLPPEDSERLQLAIENAATPTPGPFGP